MAKPNLYRGKPLPLSQLTSDEFENFVYSILSIIGKHQQFRVENGGQKSGDEGYDCTARSTLDNSLICIQCKRYSSALGADTIAEEVVKVALNGFLNNDTPSKHLTITSGTVTGSVRKMLRQKDFNDLKSKCLEKLSIRRYEKQCQSVLERGGDPDDIIKEFIDAAKIVVWSANDFECEMTIVWSEIVPLLDRFFAVEVLIHEYPRAKFDIHEYYARVKSKADIGIELNIRKSALPENIIDNLKCHQHDINSIFNYSDFINALPTILPRNGRFFIICPGGGGKTYLQKYIQKKIIEDNASSYLPVYIELSVYEKNNLDKLINSALGISQGDWNSLPSEFLFLFDGLDEMQETHVPAFVHEMQSLSLSYPCIITVRDTGLRVPTVIDDINGVACIEPLSYRQIVNLAQQFLPKELLTSFYADLHQIINNPAASFLRLPYGMVNTLVFYKAHKMLPVRFSQILEVAIENKITKDRSRVTTKNIDLNKLDNETIRAIMMALVYHARVVLTSHILSAKALSSCVFKINDYLKEGGVFFSFNSMSHFLEFISKFEILKKTNEGYVFTEHKILLDYFLSNKLKNNWHDITDEQFRIISRDTWFFVSESILPEEKILFCDFVLRNDMVIGAVICKNIGGQSLNIAEKMILEKEQSDIIIERSAAIIALGILSTPKAIARLRSNNNAIDYQHLRQRRSSLIVSGDIILLKEAVKEASSTMQFAKLSGGDYQLWYKAPVSIIMKIARDEVHEWRKDNNNFLCLALDTLRLYGDESDIENLQRVVYGTNSLKDLYSALHAIREINESVLISTVKFALNQQEHFIFYLKKILHELNEPIDFTDEVKSFMALVLCETSYQNLDMRLIEQVIATLKKWSGTISFENELFRAYKYGKQPAEFLGYNYLWSLASAYHFKSFEKEAIEIIRNNRLEFIMPALRFIDELPIQNIKNYISEINTFYLKHIVTGHTLAGVEMSLIILMDKCDNNISLGWLKIYLNDAIMKQNNNSEMSFNIKNTLALAGMMELVLKYTLELEREIVDKIILLDARSFPSVGDYQPKMLSLLSDDDVTTLFHKVAKHSDGNIIVAFIEKILIAKKHLLNKSLIIPHIPLLFSHHMYFATLYDLLSLYWDDEVESVFLDTFFKTPLDQINAQMFEKYISQYGQLLSVHRLEEYKLSVGGLPKEGANKSLI